MTTITASMLQRRQSAPLDWLDSVDGPVTLRPYQRESFDAICRELYTLGRRSTLLSSCVGSGKTSTLGMVTKYVASERSERVLVVAHRNELIEQIAERLQLLGVHAVVEKAKLCGRAQINTADRPVDAVVGSVATMKGDRLKRWSPDSFGLIIRDECFPAGTPVDGKPIESISVGDIVSSYNHKTGLIEEGVVVDLRKSRPSYMVRVHLNDGSSFCCTPGHPIYTPGVVDYKPAIYLQRGDKVYGPQQGVRRDSSNGVCPVRGGRRESVEVSDQGGTGILLDGMQGGMEIKEISRSSRGVQQEARLRKNEGQQPNAQGRCSGEDGRDTEGDELEASDSWWKWTRADGTSVALIEPARLANGSGGENRKRKREPGEIADALQVGHRQPGVDDRGRGGRILPLHLGETESGQEEGRISEWARVDRVEVLEPGSDGRFGGVCPDGLVYNIEVHGNHNYFANGILVHNCHRIHSASDLAILDHFASAKVLGVTATPYRMDGKNLGDIFESTAYSYPLRQGIIEGHLVPIKAIKANVRINLRGLKRTTSDYNVGDLEDRILPMVEFLANAVKDVIGERKTVVFAPDVRSAHAMSDALNQVGIKSASLSCKSKDRREILSDFRSGAIQTIVNYDILGEGVDVPDISCVVLMRPTRSFGLLNQQVGRGVRRSDETGKADCLVIDFDWQLDDGDPLCHVEELVATGKAGKRAAAKAAADRGDGPSDIMESMQRAEEKEEVLIRLEDRLKVLVQRRQTNLKWSAFDPVTSGCKIIGVRPPSDYEARVHKAHPNVVAALAGYGIDAKEAEGLSRRAAVEMLKWLKNRKAEGMATFKQLQMLVKSGWDRDAAVRLTKDQASITIDTIIQRRRQA